MSCHIETERDAPRTGEIDDANEQLERTTVELEPHLERAIELATD